MNNKINVGILFGGKSVEHEISVQSASNVYDAIDKDKYNVVMIGIAKDGKWYSNPSIVNGSVSIGDSNKSNPNPLALIPGSNKNQFLDLETKNIEKNDFIEKIDVVFPILHGPFGEDGTVQGLLKLANIPFVGPGVLGSAVGMDKDVMKRLLRDSQLPNANFFVLYKYLDEIPNPTYDEIKSCFGIPFFVKPANLGSSVGISKVNNADEFALATDDAFKYDTKLIVEMNIKGRELECAVLGNEKPVASLPGEVINLHDFYSYNAKYIDEHGALLEIPAKLPQEIVKKIQSTAIKAYKVLCCEGMARVDLFLTDEQEIIINEINTIPGFTKISMYPKLWEASGISYTNLIDKLIQFALERFERENQLKTSI